MKKIIKLLAVLLATTPLAFAQYNGPGVPTLTCASSGTVPATNGASWIDTSTGLTSFCVSFKGSFQWVVFQPNVATVQNGAYVEQPTALIVGSGNNTNVTTAATNATTSFTSTTLVLPVAPASATLRGSCKILWQGSSTSYTTDFGIKTSAAPTDLYWSEVGYFEAATAPAFANGVITTATTTDTSNALTPNVAATNYPLTFDFLLVNGSSANTITIMFKSSNTSGTSQVSAGSYCQWNL